MLFDKQNEKKFIVGIELREDTCQISYAFEKAGKILSEPETYAAVPGSEEYDLPLAICRVPSAGQWYHGSEAVSHAADAGCVYIPKLLTLARENVPVAVEDKTYESEALFALYINRCLTDVRRRAEAADGKGRTPQEPAAIMFTARNMDGQMIDLLENVRRRLDLGTSVYYQSAAGAFYDFVLSREEELREPASALLEYEEGGRLRISRLLFNVHTRPVVSYMEEKEYPGLFAADDAGRDQEFAEILKAELSDHRFASVYLTGSGFRGSWMKRSSRLLCQGRRAFVGDNLFSKGAAYGAFFKLEKPRILSEYFFLDQNKLRYNILIQAMEQGTQKLVTAVDAGMNWYEVQESLDLVLDGTAEIDLVLKPLSGGKDVPYHIRLDRLPVREGRITRVRFSFSMTAVDRMQVRMEDLGFGEIFPSSGLKWEQQISL